MNVSIKRVLLERRRLRAVQLSQKGWRVTDIAQALNVSVPAVSQWLATFRSEGETGLKARKRTGAPRRLSPRHSLMLQALLKRKPRENDIDADAWDRALVQRVIKRLFGVTYSHQHCGRLLKAAMDSKTVVPRVTRLELDDLLKKVDIARIRTRFGSRHGRSPL
ncbi:MAG: helix-turn-helix domain containing protein [Ignavibacteria bacterium]|nr:helix-turn-helix domain containing protein [Ignavibacteria bacterium]MBP6509640.1 helix-turn-helix domain containing protein [Candidatus Kapabacteria bacterium]MBK6420416.1 helix-turn-helix domain containing protein [Ignavibacteria bacterium]MBK6761625.1 helix-turn-helix domain containing protein [Ignavibacteria bacterium]MBK7033657.1 helix-turn-helix domain containing protein [Ignavibacteria bacterium]